MHLSELPLIEDMSKDVQQSDKEPEPELPFNSGNSGGNVQIDVTKKKLIGVAENPVGTERENN